MSAVLTEIINLLTSGLSTYAKAFGQSLADAVEAIFIVKSEAGAMSLSTTGGVIVIFAGLALAIGLTKLVFNWIVTLGGRK